MAKLKEPIFIKPHTSEFDPLVFGKSSEQALQDSEAGIARIGGAWRHPSYLLAYIKAARTLVDKGKADATLDELAMPTFYLQRHALELLIKRLLAWIYELDAFRVSAGQAAQISSGQIKRFTGSHELMKLFADLQRASKVYGFDAPPANLGEIAQRLTDFEVSDTWARYELSKFKVRHIEKEVEIPIVQIQHDLESIYLGLAYQADGGTYESALYNEWIAVASLHGSAG